MCTFNTVPRPDTHIYRKHRTKCAYSDNKGMSPINRRNFDEPANMQFYLNGRFVGSSN